MEEATFVNEHTPVEYLQIQQASATLPCADWPAEKTKHASHKCVKECCRCAVSSSGRSGILDIEPTISETEVLCALSLPELRFLTLRVIMCFPFAYAARLGKPDRGSTTRTGAALASNNYVVKEKTATGILLGDKPSRMQFPWE